MKSYVALGAVLMVLGAGGAALGHNALAGGAKAAQSKTNGLSMAPAVIEHSAAPGALSADGLKVANRSTKPLAVTVAARPWVQSASGRVAPNRRTTLSGVSVTPSTFTLAPGEEKTLQANLISAPSAGYQYGALEVIGVPTDASKRKGIVVGYRLVGTLRILPAAVKTGLTLGTPKASGQTAVIPVKNTGNTIDPVTGSVRVKGAAGTKNLTLAAVRILPGKSVNLPAGTRLAKGSYTATVSLKQRGKTVVSARKTFRVK